TGGKDDAVTTAPASPQASPSATESVVTESGDPASEPATPDPVTPTASVPEYGGDTQQGT
ncbi:MAG: hypothetical protein IJY89_03590, partial [Clostridia bacterium]|nr:hypothetical protein [Clostridia bacterium]